MDVENVVNEIAVQVQEIHLSPLRYLADPERDPLQLPIELETIRRLINGLRTKVYGMVPQGVFADHLQQSYDIETQLRALEDGLVELPAREERENRTRAQRAPDAIAEDDLRHLLDSGMTDIQIGSFFGLSARTVARRRGRLHLERRAAMHAMTDQRLAEHIEAAWENCDAERTGAIMIWSYLKSQKIPCTRDQVRRVVGQLQPEAVAERTKKVIKRRDYRAPLPNFVWHVDGHHKLNQWKFVIHGEIDGHSHLIMFMHVADNNRADTVTELFLEATEEYGWPQKVRADFGGENLGVAEEMVVARGGERSPFIQGKSSRSQRIERLWRDVGKHVGLRFSKTFKWMEKNGYIDPDDALHFYYLHFVYKPLVQASVDNLFQAWNHHNMSSKGCKGSSPVKQWQLGMINAQRNGFAFNHFPNRNEDQPGPGNPDAGGLNVDRYGLPDDGLQFREPLSSDPHVDIPRFGEVLPPTLHRQAFQERLRVQFPPGNCDQAMDQYVAVLEFVTAALAEPVE
ncbi:hypothetical protein QFC20_006775 [Naganishia adeliensis]|uniref:Uncharacterized protein n=1 Tax=Naganishia adeliensis TaxID=92952 RepID=A0ACC2V8D6_9TREE|nr:hypothetical protein QFC20_006775 [Naganishia adeliensis]